MLSEHFLAKRKRFDAVHHQKGNENGGKFHVEFFFVFDCELFTKKVRFYAILLHNDFTPGQRQNAVSKELYNIYITVLCKNSTYMAIAIAIGWDKIALEW